MKKKMNKKGFTIVELVIVIAVIGVLAAVLVPTFVGIVNKAKKSADDQLVKNANVIIQMETALEPGKGLDGADVAEMLEANGISKDAFNDAKTDGYKFYWDAENNKIVCDTPENAGNKQELQEFLSAPKTVEVKNIDDLTDALGNSNVKTIKLTNDINATERLEVQVEEGKDRKLTIDLNGKKLDFGTCEAYWDKTIRSYILVINGNVTINNGEINGGLSVEPNANLELEEVSIINATKNECIYQNYSSTVTINGGEIRNTGSGDAIKLNGFYESSLTIEGDTTVTAEKGYWINYSDKNCTAVIKSGTFTGNENGGGFNIANNSAVGYSLTIEEGTFKTEQAPQMFNCGKNATVQITGGEFTTYGNSIFDTNGANITIGGETTTFIAKGLTNSGIFNIKSDSQISISGGTFETEGKGRDCSIFYLQNSAEEVNVTINGGNFSISDSTEPKAEKINGSPQTINSAFVFYSQYGSDGVENSSTCFITIGKGVSKPAFTVNHAEQFICFNAKIPRKNNGPIFTLYKGEFSILKGDEPVVDIDNNSVSYCTLNVLQPDYTIPCDCTNHELQWK